MKINEMLKRAYEVARNEEDQYALFWLLKEELSLNNTEFYLKENDEVDEKNINQYFEKVEKYINENIPVQYLMGYTYFYGRKILVNENTLIPRRETEELVYRTIKYIDEYFKDKTEINVLDLATGSGCIGLTLKLEKNYNVDISDISIKALEVAKENINLYQSNITSIQSDWFSNIKDKYDVIISNPPYISELDMLDKKVLKEPNNALFSGIEGIDSYKEILSNINKHINDKAIIIFEHGHKQKDLIANLIKNTLKDVKILQEKDLSNKDRYTFVFI